MIDTGSINETGENVMHFGGVRIRVVGNGNLRPTFYSLNNVNSSQLVPLVMSATNAVEPFRLGNFISQRAFLRLETIALDEIFRINRIVVFARPMWSQYPGQ